VLVIPVGSGAMLNSICKGFEEMMELGIISDISNLRIIAAQPQGCAPIVDAYKNRSNEVIPVERPDTIAKSLAIGDPGDGPYVLKRLRQFNGIGEDVSNDEIKRAILLLAKTEGIFTEPAGGVSVGVLKKLIEDNKIDRDEKIVCYVTGNGLKTTESILDLLPTLNPVKPNIQLVSAMIQ
jgi:threonine synthase